MAKELDWDHVFEGNFEDKRRLQGFKPFREHLQEAHKREAQAEQDAALTKAMEPHLKAVLLEFCVSKRPILVKAAFANPTEKLGGLTKSLVEGQDDEDDGFYYNGGKQAENPTSFNASFQEVMETIPAGTELIFKSYDKHLDKMVFRAKTGAEVEIYTKPLVLFQGNQIKNPGYYGLLYQTNVREALG